MVSRLDTMGQNARMAGEIEDIRGRLEGIAEELADLAIVRLRDSIDNGGTELPVDEKLITRARRAVEKAVHLLESGDRAAEREFDLD
jgi:hypothetical protein